MLRLFNETLFDVRWKKILFSVVLRGLLSVLFGYFLSVLCQDALSATEIFYYRVLFGLVYIVWLLWSTVVIILLLCKKATILVNAVGSVLCFLLLSFTGCVMGINFNTKISVEKVKSNTIAQVVITDAGNYAPVNLELDSSKCISLFGMHIEKGEASLVEDEDTVLFVSVEYVEDAPSLVVNEFLQKEQERINRYSPSIKIEDQIMNPKGEWVAGSSENGTEYLYLYTPLINSLNLLVKNTGQNQACSIYLDLPLTAPAIESQAVVNVVIEQIEKLAT